MLEKLIKNLLENKNNGGETTIVAMHCSQMREFGVRGGSIEMRPIQDDPNNTRLKFFKSIWEHNQLAERLDNIMDNFVCRGEILWYFQPDPSNDGKYLIEYFVGGLNNPDPQYKLFYKKGGRDIDKVYIRYSYDTETGINPVNHQYTKKWVLIKIDSNYISISESIEKPDFNYFTTQNNNISNPAYNNNIGVSIGANRNTSTYENPFKPFLPIVISKNKASQLGQSGSDDFTKYANLIDLHESLVSKAHKNLKMFANPILITTRTPQEVLQRESEFSNTWAAANRFVDGNGGMYSGSTNTSDAYTGYSRNNLGMQQVNYSEGQLNTIVGGVGEGERFGFIQADAVSGDQNLWIKQLRESIHWVLGGVDPQGISANATFGEIKTLFGRVENTAIKKSNSLFGFTGIAKVFERILHLEEQKFKYWFFQQLKIFNIEYFQNFDFSKLTDEICQKLWEYVQEGKIKISGLPLGIIPLGDRKVSWRFTRDVFLNTTREQLDKSIAARNEREDGLSQDFVLRKQYPNMTDQEIRNAMSGFSPRVVEKASQSIQQILQIYGALMQIPDPENPKIPWGVSLGISEILRQAVRTLKKEIDYAQPKYEEAEELPNFNQYIRGLT